MFRTQWAAYFAVMLAMLIWSLSFIWSKEALAIYSPLFILPSRLLVASVLIFIFGKLSGRLQVIHRRDYKWLLLLAFFEPFLYFIGENYGLQRVSATIAAVIIATIPLFLPFVAKFFFQEQITKAQSWGIVISFIGVGMVLVNKQMKFTADAIGIAFLILAVVAALGYTSILKKVTQEYNPITIVAWQSIIAGLYFLPFFVVLAYEKTITIGFRWEGIEPIILLAIFGSSIAFIAYTQSIRMLGITKSGVFVNTIPVLTAIFSFFLLDEQLLWINYLGIILVIGGLFFSQGKKL